MSLGRTYDKKHWLKKLWFGAIRQQAIIWVNVDSVLRNHMAPTGKNGLKLYWEIVFSEKLHLVLLIGSRQMGL